MEQHEEILWARPAEFLASEEVPPLEHSYGKNAADLRAQALAAALDGARAALGSFYFAFNHRSMEALASIWADDPLASLNNPVGGITRGLADIIAIYMRIFAGPARVWVEFHDNVEFASADTVVFAGRERGEFLRDGTTVALHIRIPTEVAREAFFKDPEYLAAKPLLKRSTVNIARLVP
jgi:hypothetical protein